LIESLRPLYRTPPAGLEIVNPGEFCRADGVILAWSGWGLDLIGDIAYAIAVDDMVYMVVHDAGAQAYAYDYLHSRGVRMDHVEFIQDPGVPNPSMWIRDYGPFCACEDGDPAIVDFFYGSSGGNDEIPETIATHFGLPYYESNLLHHGGNHITDGNGMGFGSTNIWAYNSGFSEAQIRNVFRDYLGIDSLVVIEPMAGDLTHHIDMFCKLLSDTLFIVGEYADPSDGYPGDYELLNALADDLGSMRNLDDRPFSVARMPMGPYDPNGPHCPINRTYTNSLILNDKVLVPIYGADTDSAALAVYEGLMPDHEIIGIDSEFIIAYAGAVHCVTSCLHSANPLVVLHCPIDEVHGGQAPCIDFSINPVFDDMQASVFYKLSSEPEFTEVPASYRRGVWSAVLPTMMENFSYYIAGSATSGGATLPVALPEDAPATAFDVSVDITAVAQDRIPIPAVMSSYPNPFRTQTTISFALPAPGPVNLSVYDIRGRLVQTLVEDKRLKTGDQQVVWAGFDKRGRRAAPGVYLLRIESPTIRETRRIVLVR
jgi:agmatine/peptidylarginine deiminase